MTACNQLDPAGWQALGAALATAAAVFAPITAPAAPALYVLFAVRLRRVCLQPPLTHRLGAEFSPPSLKLR
ncbi:hypothetical protein AB0D14_44470 [Streptomyces sp. NPDC048484]|uniref:hypothetical protein n=1 Tax=Streptomyces sp. NPDC048484 TaxID=3155146 RepID=UPI0034250CFB